MQAGSTCLGLQCMVRIGLILFCDCRRGCHTAVVSLMADIVQLEICLVMTISMQKHAVAHHSLEIHNRMHAEITKTTNPAGK